LSISIRPPSARHGSISACRIPSFAAPPTARSGTAIQRQPKGTQPPPPQPPQQKLADDESRRFDSTYHKVVINYTHLGSQQHDAIDSIYTEAKKPTPPSLAVEILIALATAALGIPISLLGQKLEQAALKWLLPKVADPAQTTIAVLKASAQKATDAVKMFAKAANDALKDGVKALVGPYVRKNITDRKLPIDAFFEGLKRASTDNAQKGSNAAEDNREPIRGLGTVDPALPQAIANVLLEAQTETFATAYDMQQEQTLRQWLDYQAQAAVGSVGGPTPGHDDPSVIDLHALDPNRVRHADTAGIVFGRLQIGPELPGRLQVSMKII